MEYIKRVQERDTNRNINRLILSPIRYDRIWNAYSRFFLKNNLLFLKINRKLKIHAGLTMNAKQAYQICKKEKEQAMKQYNSAHSPEKYDFASAIRAWEDMQECFGRPGKTTSKHLEKSKSKALRIVNMISNPSYRQNTANKIQKINI